MLLGLLADEPTPLLLRVDPGLAIWTAITFGLVVLLLRRFAWPTISKALADRESSIQESMDRAEKALAEARKVQSDNEAARRQAEQQAQTILREAREASEQIRATEKEKLSAEITRMREAAGAEIEQQKQRAIEELRAQVTELAIGAAGKILQENMDTDRQRGLVGKFIDELRRN
jgi:F-type H+-transporting ATPase subunit b